MFVLLRSLTQSPGAGMEAEILANGRPQSGMAVAPTFAGRGRISDDRIKEFIWNFFQVLV